MSGESPDVILYDSLGNAFAVHDGVAIPRYTPALMIAGSDGADSRYFLVDAAGRCVIAGAGSAGAPNGGVVSIQGVTSGTALPISGTVDITAPTLTKGTQGSTGFSTQDLKDAGRSIRTYVVSAQAGTTTETLISLIPYTNFIAGSAATTFAITAGKTLRLQTMSVTWHNASGAASGVMVRFRVNATGAATISSPVQLALAVSTASTNLVSNTSSIDFPDGFELSGTQQFSITQLAATTAVGFDFSIIGYMY